MSASATPTAGCRSTGRSCVLRGDVQSGNSGGPIVDGAGRVVGTVFAQRRATDDGYAVPNEQVLSAVGERRRPALETSCVER